MIFPIGENENLKSTVLGFIKSGRIPHAILIEGDNAELSARFADYIAAACVCEGENAPCGMCRQCHTTEIKSNPDVSYTLPLDGKKFISVNQIRTLRAEAFVKPHSAAKRVFIIDGAQRMNEQAQNALLKVLEEPPKSVVFILTAPSKSMLLNTVVSRCVLLSLYSNEQSTDETSATAHEFIRILLEGSEYELLKLMTPLEKSRVKAEQFFACLAVEISERLSKSTHNARVLDRLYDDTKYYIDLLKTNINMSLLTSLVVSRSKGLLNK